MRPTRRLRALRSRRHPAATAALTLVVVAMFAAGCGSTAQVGLEGPTIPGEASAGGVSSDGGLALSDDGMSVVAEAGDTATTDGLPGEAPASGGGAGATTGGAAAGGAAAAGPGGGTNTGGTAGGGGGKGGGGGSSPSTGAGRMGPGVTAKEIVVGIAIADDSSKAANENMLGASGITTGDTERYYKIMADEINKKGGIAGRKVRYSIFRYSTADGTAMSQLEQEACTHWTQDDRAYTAQLSSGQNFLTCAEKNQLSTTSEGITTSDDTVFATYPHHLGISAMSLTRQMALFPKALDRAGYFDAGYKLGIVTYDHPNFARAVDGTLVPALRAQGKHVDAEIQRITYLNSTDQIGQLTAEVQSAVLRFKSQGITHVVIPEEDAVLALLFTRSAENQNYRPRYGLNSQNGPTAIAANVPQGQYNRAVGMGWLPQLDVPPREEPKSAARQRCLARYKAKGQEPANANNAGVMVGICERMDFIKAAVEAGGPDITFDSFVRGAESLRDTFPAYLGLGNAVFGPGRHAGASYYRLLKYDPSCTCFHYTSKPIRAA